MYNPNDSVKYIGKKYVEGLGRSINVITYVRIVRVSGDYLIVVPYSNPNGSEHVVHVDEVAPYVPA